MAKKKVETAGPIGPLIAENLYRLGYGDITIRHSEVARLVTEKTGQNFSRQRVAAVLNAVRVEPETVELLAKAIGVKASELTKRAKKG